MPFHLLEDEALPDGLRRIAGEQIAHAHEVLSSSPVDRDEAIHIARKCFKKLRAILRLVREEIGDDVFDFENRFFRDLGRSLSGERDIASVREAVDRLIVEAEGKATLPLLHELNARLIADGRNRTIDPAELDRIIGDVLAKLDEASARLADWPLERDRFTAIDRGLKRIYKQGRSAYGVVTGEPTDEHLHEWRKQVKYLWYCARFLECSWPEVFDAMVHELHELSDSLGDDHDLALVRTILHEHPDLAGSDEDVTLLFGLIDERRAAMQETAKSLGARIYSERSKPFIRRMRMYWKAWRVK